MDATALVDRLARFADILPALIAGLPDQDARWKPEDGNWSILEIVTHIADEEAEDFRPRLESTLRDPDAAWDPIDPEGAAVERRYNEGDLGAVVERFVAARRESVSWLRRHVNPAWSNTFRHKLGDIRAGDILVSWVAHDALHLRQIAKRLFQLTERDGGECAEQSHRIPAT